MIPLNTALLASVAFLIGITAAMTGVGGGVFIVPLLSLAYDFSFHQAIGTSLATIVFTSLFSAIGYWRQRRIDHNIGLILTLTTIPGTFVGAYLTSFIEEKLLGLIFGVFLVFVALCMALRARGFAIQSLPCSDSKDRKDLAPQDCGL